MRQVASAFPSVEGVATGERERKIRLQLSSMEKRVASTGEAIGSAEWHTAIEHIDSIGRTLMKVRDYVKVNALDSRH